MLNQSILDKLATVDSPSIANIIELFDIRSKVAGYTNDTIKAIYPDLPPVVGYAATATYRGGHPTPKKDGYGGLARVIATGKEVGSPQIAVIQDLDDPILAAVFGEVMVSGFRSSGYEALITNGAGRDYMQVKHLNFPCFASSLIVSHGYCNILDSGVTVMIGGLEIRPGDLLHADANGVVNVPVDIADLVAEMIDPFMAAEQIALDIINRPKATFEMINEACVEMIAQVAECSIEAKALLAKRTA